MLLVLQGQYHFELALRPVYGDKQLLLNQLFLYIGRENRFIFISGIRDDAVVKCGSQEVIVSRAVLMLSRMPSVLIRANLHNNSVIPTGVGAISKCCLSP